MDEKEKRIKQKINLYLTENTGIILENDARYFEIYKKNRDINRNNLLSNILLGYYYDYMAERNEDVSDLKNTVELNKKVTTYEWALKETENNKDILNEIIQNAYQTGLDKAELMRNIFDSYCKMPFYIREQIVFRETYNKLCEVCSNRETIAIKYKWSDKGLHHVIPYKMAVGNEEMFNYLLCVEVYNGKQITRTYRLNRIESVRLDRKEYVIDKQVEKYLKQMLIHGPQYAINDDIDICVSLTSEGLRKFDRIYHGRPMIKKPKVGLNYFKCSQDQAFIYFRKLGKDAIIISPKELKEKMERFFEDSYKAYKTLDVKEGDENG